MTHPEPFGDQRDPRLDAALRELLDGQSHEVFVARVMGLIKPRASAWDELARWARPGIAAAVVALAMLGVWGALQIERSVAPTDVVDMAGLEPLDTDGLVGVALGAIR
jgi:hypothetical protein